MQSSVNERFAMVLMKIIHRDSLDKNNDEHAHRLIGKGYRMLNDIISQKRNVTIEHILNIYDYDNTISVNYIIHGLGPVFVNPVATLNEPEQHYQEDKLIRLINFIKKEL